MEFHHIGVACENLDRERTVWEALGYREEGAVFEDPIQGIAGQFLVGAGPRMELVAPLNAASTVLAGVLAQRIKLYHTAYLVADMAAALEGLRARRAKLVSAPQPAVAFGMREIAFLAMPNRMLVELIQAER